MKVCRSCDQLYADESYFYCLHDGSSLTSMTNAEATLMAPHNASVITVVARKLVGDLGSSSFVGKHVFEDIATDGLAMKILPDDDEDGWVTFAFKITLQNRSIRKKSVYVTVKALDADGFEVQDYTLTTNLQPHEIRTITDKNFLEVAKFKSIVEWSLEEISGHDE